MESTRDVRDLEDELEDYTSFFYAHQELQTKREDSHQLLGLPFGLPFNYDPFPGMEDWRLLFQLTEQSDNIYFLLHGSKCTAF